MTTGRKALTAFLLGILVPGSGQPCSAADESRPKSVVLLNDDFSGLPPGPLLGVVGAHTEYHYLSEAAGKGNWSVSCFVSAAATQRAWQVLARDGKPALQQSYENVKDRHWHPLVVAGDPLWRDYTITARFTPEASLRRNGLVFRYRNDRCYYFFGVEEKAAVLKLVRHETAFHKPFEKVLARREITFASGAELTTTVALDGARIRATLGSDVVLEAEDDTFPAGRIGFVSDAPCTFSSVRVECTPAAQQRLVAERTILEQEHRKLEAAHTPMRLWKRIKTEGFGVGRNVRFGDLNGDGTIDVLFGQVVHHGPKDTNSEVSCLTAMTFEGEKLWQVGRPDAWKDHLTNDVAFQVHDLDGDGQNEIIYCKDFELIVADGATGATKYKTGTPDSPADSKPPQNRFPKILGDSLYFCDLRGLGRRGDILLKDRYYHVWAFNEKLELLWKTTCNTGHYPFAADVDGDGKDEVAIGYSLYDDDGKPLWTLDEQLQQHADSVALVRLEPGPNAPLRWLSGGSDEGMMFGDLKGQIQKHHYIGHAQNVTIADFRDDLPGLEVVSMNFWSNQGIIHLYDARGDIYHDFEPCQHGSMCLPVNWTGKPPELFLLSPSVVEGGLFDGHGRRAMTFPNDGHPDLCAAALDLTGDCRDEIVVWDPFEMWVYTQADGPKSGRLYQPVRNPTANESNYRANLSLPGWSK